MLEAFSWHHIPHNEFETEFQRIPVQLHGGDYIEARDPMAYSITGTCENIIVYGSDSCGGKGQGLIRINSIDIPGTEKLRTHILTTAFYDSFIKQDGSFTEAELDIFKVILDDLGDVPIGVRSSATNEAGVSIDDKQYEVHAGENISFMLPNNHGDVEVRIHQLQLAIKHIFEDFRKQQPEDSQEKMAILVTPIPGMVDDTKAGSFYYPYISGVANSYFPHALETQDPHEGFARIAFGHGYATVLDDFPVISMATIANPISPKLMQVREGQQFFYALSLSTNSDLRGDELETMKKLHVRFANFHRIKELGVKGNYITIEELVQNDQFGFKSRLQQIMETIASHVDTQFQIEFVFNLDVNTDKATEGVFHIVQLTLLPESEIGPIQIPDSISRTYLSIEFFQGHGVKKAIKYCVVLSPFLYSKSKHDVVTSKLIEINRSMKKRNEKYILIVPGRLGSTNKEWGLKVDFKDVNQAAAIFEYGVDIAGRAEPLPEKGSRSGGIYGSHFLYMILGAYSEEQRRLKTRMYGTQGTHFLTNIVSNNMFYGYVAPGRDTIDPWFFSASAKDDVLSLYTFDQPVTLYADSLNKRCCIVEENTQDETTGQVHSG